MKMSNETMVTLVGNLTSDPELRYTQEGLAVANFTVATTPRTFDRTSNEWKDGETAYLRCSVWREYAENVAASLQKGARVMVLGALGQRGYETKEGEKRTTFEVSVHEIGPVLRYAIAAVTRMVRPRDVVGATDWTPSPKPGGKRADETPAATADAPF